MLGEIELLFVLRQKWKLVGCVSMTVEYGRFSGIEINENSFIYFILDLLFLVSRRSWRKIIGENLKVG